MTRVGPLSPGLSSAPPAAAAAAARAPGLAVPTARAAAPLLSRPSGAWSLAMSAESRSIIRTWWTHCRTMRPPTQQPGERQRTSGGARRVLGRVRRGRTRRADRHRVGVPHRAGFEVHGGGHEDLRAARRAGCRAGDLITWPWPGFLHAAGAVYSLIYEGENGGPVRCGRGGRGGGRCQLGAAAGPSRSGSILDGAGSCHVPSRGFGAACRATGHGRACSPLPPSLTCPGGQGRRAAGTFR